MRALVLVFFIGVFSQAAVAATQPGASSAVRQLVEDWAAAWQSGDFNEYASYYVGDFRGGFPSAEAWRKARRSRIAGRKDIRIDLGSVLVQLNRDDANIARAIFLQSYQSDTWCDVVEKTLMLVRTKNGWRISDEISSLRRRC